MPCQPPGPRPFSLPAPSGFCPVPSSPPHLPASFLLHPHPHTHTSKLRRRSALLMSSTVSVVRFAWRANFWASCGSEGAMGRVEGLHAPDARTVKDTSLTARHRGCPQAASSAFPDMFCSNRAVRCDVRFIASRLKIAATSTNTKNPLSSSWPEWWHCQREMIALVSVWQRTRMPTTPAHTVPCMPLRLLLTSWQPLTRTRAAAQTCMACSAPCTHP